MGLSSAQKIYYVDMYPYRTHGNFNASSRLPDKYHGVQVQIIIACRLWASKRGGATFTLDINALDIPGGPLSEVRDWFCAKIVVRVPNSGGGPLRVNPQALQ